MRWICDRRKFRVQVLSPTLASLHSKTSLSIVCNGDKWIAGVRPDPATPAVLSLINARI